MILLDFLVERTWYIVCLGVGDRVEGMLLVHLASLNGHTEVVRMLLTWTQSKHCIRFGVVTIDVRITVQSPAGNRVLAEHCANVNYTRTKNEGLTALHDAVMNGNEEIVSY